MNKISTVDVSRRIDEFLRKTASNTEYNPIAKIARPLFNREYDNAFRAWEEGQENNPRNERKKRYLASAASTLPVTGGLSLALSGKAPNAGLALAGMGALGTLYNSFKADTNYYKSRAAFQKHLEKENPELAAHKPLGSTHIFMR